MTQIVAELDDLARHAVLTIQGQLRVGFVHHHTIPNCNCSVCVAIGVLYGYHCIASPSEVSADAPEGPWIEVVAAVRRDGDRYWVCRRTDDGSHGGLSGMWEYPGGKVEEGETPRQALHREMMEEFGTWTVVEEQIGHPIVASAPGSNTQYRVTFFAVTFSDEPKLSCHDKAKWCTVKELQLDKHLPSGQEFNARLLADSADAPEGPWEELKADRDRLRAALIEHRADLHGYSTRPCPTCRQSAEALGIHGWVPNSCSQKRTDHPALNRLDAQQTS